MTAIPEHPRKFESRYKGKPEDQFIIPVPALVSEDAFDTVAEQLIENRKHCRQREAGTMYMLQGLLECGCCGYAYYGHGMSRFVRSRNKVFYPYYRCFGTDGHRYGGRRICSNKPVRVDRVEAEVWADVCAVLQNPADLQQEFERRLNGEKEPDVNVVQVTKQIAATRRSISRLIDAYETGLLEKTEFEPRIQHAKQRIERLEKESAAAVDHAAQQAELRLVLSHMDQFAQQVRQGLGQADMLTRREIIRSLVKVIKIEPEHVRIIYRVSPRPFADGRSCGPIRQQCNHRVQRNAHRGPRRRRQGPVPQGRSRPVGVDRRRQGPG